MRIHRICLYLFVLGSADLASADNWSYRVTPMVRSSSIYYPEALAGTENFRSAIHSELNAVAKYGKNLKFVAQPVVDYDPTAKKSPRFDPLQKDNSERLFADLREAYLQIRVRPITITAGNQIFNWGVMDGFSPTDVVNSRRMVSPISADKLGAPAVTLSGVFGDFNAEIVYLPIQRFTILPGEDSRWLPRSVYLNRSFEGVYLRLPQKINYYYLPREVLDRSDRDNLGARMRGQLAGIDFALVYFEGMANSPAVNLNISAVPSSILTGTATTLILDSNVGLKPVYYRRRLMGGSIVVPVADFILRYEGAYTQQISPGRLRALPGDYAEHSLSLEYDVPIPEGKLTTQVQGTRAQYKTSSENGTTSLGRIFDRGFAAGVRYAPDERWSLIGTFVYDTLRAGTITILSAEHKVLDTLSVSLSASIIDGQGLTPLGTYTKNDLIALSARYDF